MKEMSLKHVVKEVRTSIGTILVHIMTSEATCSVIVDAHIRFSTLYSHTRKVVRIDKRS